MIQREDYEHIMIDLLHRMRERPEKLNFWACMVADRVIGPIFFKENLSGVKTFLEFLQEELVRFLESAHTRYPKTVLISWHKENIICILSY